MLTFWLRCRTRLSRRPSLRLESLETRLAPAVGTSYVNDNWVVITDVDTSGTLTAGDTVRNDNDTINPGSVVGVFGTDAFSTINDAIANTVAFGTVTVLEGTYNENVVIDKNLTFQSNAGRDLTTINGQGTSAPGTILVTGTTTAVTIGGTSKGFTINGIDNASPGIESAAVYLQGNHTGTTIRGNVINANGDEALLSEFGATVSGLTIDANAFGGKTFTGTNPAGDGFSAQFTLANVPRQLVIIGGGSGGGNTSNVTFTNNQITGTAGGISITDNSGTPPCRTSRATPSSPSTPTAPRSAATPSPAPRPASAVSLRARGPARRSAATRSAAPA